MLSIVLVISMVVVTAVTASAEKEHTYYAVGGAPLFNPEWAPNAEDYKMTKHSDTEYVVSIPVNKELWGETIPYRVSQNGTWDVCYNEEGLALEPDCDSYISIVKNTFAVDIWFNTETKRSSYALLFIPIGEPDPTQPSPTDPAEEEHTYYAVGSEPLFNPQWTPNADVYKMTKRSETEYAITLPVSEDLWGESMPYRVVEDGTWDVSYNEEGQAWGPDCDSYIGIVKNTFAVDIIFNIETKRTSYALLVIPVEEPAPTEPIVPTEEATAPTEEAPTEEDPTEVTTAPTEEAPTYKATEQPTTTDTTKTTSTTTATETTKPTANTALTATGKVATGNSTTVALIIGVLMLAGAGIVSTRKKITK